MKIELQTKITPDSILIQSEQSNTIFVQASMPPMLSLTEFKMNFAQLKARCKQHKVRLYQAGAKAFVENYGAYADEWRRLSGLFAQLRDIALVIEAEGLEAPTVDNVRLKEMRPINAEFLKGFWVSTIHSKMNETFRFVLDLLKKDLSNYQMIRV